MDDQAGERIASFQKFRGAVKGPLRLRASVPARHREGNRNGYPVIDINEPRMNSEKDFPENSLYTTKYTLWSFLPKVLIEQCRKATSMFFIVVVIITCIPQISPVSPYTSISGLVFILAVSAVREAYEDWLRFRADVKVNNKPFTTIEPGTGQKKRTLSYRIKVGHLVYVDSGSRVPVDMVILATSNASGVAFMETAPLDGETNLKPVKAVAATQGKTLLDIASLRGSIVAEAPNHKLYQFRGSLELEGEPEPISLDEKQLLLMGSFLKNTAWAVGVCIYAGPETKLGLNLKPPPSKFSQLDRKLNKYVFSIFALDMALCTAMTVLNHFFETSDAAVALGIGQKDPPILRSIGLFFSYFALLNYLIPLSLVVTLDCVRFIQAQFITWDAKMTHGDKHCIAKTSNLNDELALVDYIFSDKTGTLTENLMIFKSCSVAGQMYSDGPESGSLQDVVLEADQAVRPKLELFLLAMSVCNSVQVDHDPVTDAVIYKAASPDEEALCNGARTNGVIFLGREGTRLNVDVLGQPKVFELLAEMEFSSDRRRMSVILRAEDGQIILLCKGADSIIMDRLADTESNRDLLGVTSAHLDTFSQQGLRTLLLGYRVLSDEEWLKWRSKWVVASNLIHGREAALETLSDSVERELVLIGATAIEDKLQAGVPHAIQNLRRAGIKVWVITGDKQETAINIGYSSRLLAPHMHVLKINGSSSDETGALLESLIQDYIHARPLSRTHPLAAVVDGKTLSFILADHKECFLSLVRNCVSVICNRVTPLQKAEVVKLVAEGEDAVTLSIGDGGNDVPMIQQAHIGVGIQGREGNQAARAADFAVPQFRHVERLLTVHGRYCLMRNTKIIYYSFYKNIATFMTQIWFSIFSGFSSQTLFDDWVMTAFNMVFTAAPIGFLGMFEKDLVETIISRVRL
eukprot:TRINITY_DN965_c0_g1_i1.p1 TRINITY_DN965_c0_g1~~TRINITY_DN965_c0_g1_i1.p1  ORF type:complete len:918 (-),score=99.81 TRINITY_DN965_c0_g1_i1:823-3576(-)